MSDVKLITKILNDIRRHLDDADHSKLLQECEYLGLCIGKCFMSAMTVYRLRKISRLSKNYLNENVQSLKVEIADLIQTLTRLVYWRCGTCGKIVDAENENNLELWIHAHKIICKRKENMDKLIA